MSKLPRLDHASLIKRSWQKQVANLIRTGRRLAKARADLGEREWNLMLLEDEIPFSRDVAERLIEIAEDPSDEALARLPF